MSRDDDPEELHYRQIREEGARQRAREPEDLGDSRSVRPPPFVGVGAAIGRTLGVPVGNGGDTASTTVPDSLPCRFCSVPIEVDPGVFDTFAQLNRLLEARGFDRIDPLSNRSDRPVCVSCRHKVDSKRRAMEDEAHRCYLAAKRRLLETVRPDAVEAGDWAVIRDHGGDVEVRDVRAKRGRRSRGAEL